MAHDGPPPPLQAAHGGRRRHLVSPHPTSSSSLPRCGRHRRRQPPPLPPRRRRSSSTRRRVLPLHGGSGDGSLRRWHEEPYHLARAATPGSVRAATLGSASPTRWRPAPARWWLAGGGPYHGPAMCCIFLIFFFCLPCVLRHGARQSETIAVRFRPGRMARCRVYRAFFTGARQRP
jgi:hypothetical protein